jgi:alpha-glucosidase
VHDVHRRWRKIADECSPARLLVGETFVDRLEEVIPFYGDGDELNLAFHIPFMQAPFAAGALRELVAATERLLPDGCTPVWTGSNHDMSRLPTRWAADNAAATRCALLMLLTLRGTTFLYYGDELGMPDTDIPHDRLRDPVSIALAPVHNRDAARTPMPWTGDVGAGFTEPGIEPWLPFGDVAACNVADQHTDRSSTLHLVRDLIALRKELADLRGGDYRALETSGSVWAWQRGRDVVVALNLSDEVASIDVEGTVSLSTDRSRDGESVEGALTLSAWEGVVLRRV